MGLNPSHIVQVAVPVLDIDRARAFYRDVLGLTHLFDAPPSLSFFQCGQTRLMLGPREGAEPVAGPILYYNVPDAGAAQADLVAAGAPLVQPAHLIARVAGKDIHLAICRDSEGNMVGLMSETPTV
ncbi:VOC family protein [Niveispirillum sp. KHB5.9]|uniref:VOC family protein n=1 Tax=Niveispirillum sp. KHB5.9 TaxID=3400269 RepID=UPI003A879501